MLISFAAKPGAFSVIWDGGVAPVGWPRNLTRTVDAKLKGLMKRTPQDLSSRNLLGQVDFVLD